VPFASFEVSKRAGSLGYVTFNRNIHHRRSIRLTKYDYASPGYYFVTICTEGRDLTLAEPRAREIVAETWLALADRFLNVSLDEFVMMPDHVHGVVVITKAGGASLGKILRAFKSISAIAVNRAPDRHERPVWQRNYYERIIRNERELIAVREYVRANPAKAHCHPQEPEF